MESEICLSFAASCNQYSARFGMGYLHNFDWGCKAGVHTGWVTIEAEDEKQAVLVAPPFLRNKARAIKIVKFSAEQVKETHPE